MELPTTFRTLASESQAEFKDKGSRFIAFAYPISSVDEVKPLVDTLKQHHHKARHWCFAWRLGVDGLQFRSNDDGEPAGSAGRPILGQIDSAELTDVLVVVVRYFGGTLLGVPGLIHAYKTATHIALQNAEIIEKNVEKTVWLRCDYPHLNDALHIAKQFGVDIITRQLELDCRLNVKIPLATYSQAIEAWQQTRVIDVLEN